LTKSERVEDTFVRSLKSERTDNTKTKNKKNPQTMVHKTLRIKRTKNRTKTPPPLNLGV
jgi:hypothetical protein